MAEGVQKVALEIIRESLKKLPKAGVYMELSKKVKKAMDSEIGGPWHCVVGARFACNTSNDGQGYMHLKVGHYLHVIVYRTCPITSEQPPLMKLPSKPKSHREKSTRDPKSRKDRKSSKEPRTIKEPKTMKEAKTPKEPKLAKERR
ncbi:hypothetical protein L596_023972 [Steinernema carpocapsae]|uniref:Dynein light chain n=1 Tax=Steinernema carpocapsae TaxID=34508 RepID=A0A4V5ZZK2_STECR|nr:hypothetical protein L596_023972 [Steinernema carpocapsae]